MSTLQFRVLASLASFMVLMCCLASCTTMKAYKQYEGDPLPDDKVVHLINEGSKIFVRGDKILIHAVDGVKSSDGEKPYGPGDFELLPGDHTLTVSYYRFFSITRGCAQDYYRSTSTQKVDVTFKTEAGHTYLLTCREEPKQENWYLLVKDKVKDRIIFEAGPFPCETVKIWRAVPPVSYCG